MTLPNSVVDMFSGSLGEPEGGWPKTFRTSSCMEATPKPGRPGEHLPAVDLKTTQQELSEKIGREATRDRA